MYYIIFANGSYIITDDIARPSALTWVVLKKNILEISGDIRGYGSNSSDKYIFPKYGNIRGESDINTIYYNMINVIFLHGSKNLRSK